MKGENLKHTALLQGSCTGWKRSLSSDSTALQLFPEALLVSPQTLQFAWCGSGLQQPLLFSLGRKWPFKLDQFQGLPKAMFECFSFLLKEPSCGI